MSSVPGNTRSSQTATTAMATIARTSRNNHLEGLISALTAIDMTKKIRSFLRIDRIQSNLAEDQRTVSTAEPEVVLHRVFNRHGTRRIGAVIKITFGILIKDVDSRRRNLMMQSQYSKD